MTDTTEHSKNKSGPEIEITDDMRDAGAGAYYEGDLRFDSAEEIASAIYIAMEKAKASKRNVPVF